MTIGVVLAGGRGERMAASRNKALLELAGKPLLLHSVETLRGCCERLVVVAGADDLDAMRKLLPDAVVVAGGATRHGSEWNALAALRVGLGETDVVAIHDAARPLIAAADVYAVVRAAERHGAAMLGAPAGKPALEPARGVVTKAYPGGGLWRAQTPQAARASWLLDAYEHAAAERFDGTDTAAVLARAGYAVRMVPATAPNPKITVPADLREAEALLAAG
ncbi:MAG TPA: IspD/TarI family cytidylyltransferase [Chloroflexota bacterium]